MAKRLYMVQTGETLKSIAVSQLDEEARWQELAYINSLKHPYFITPGQLLLLPDNDQPLELVVTAPIEKSNTGNAVDTAVDFKLSPAELGLLLGGVVFVWWLWQR